MTACTSVGFAENVIPKRSLPMPAGGSDANLFRCEWRGSYVTGHRLARREFHTLFPLQITDRKRVIVLDLTLTGDGYRQLNECAHEFPIHFLGPLRRWPTGRVEEQ